jgi:DNA-binding Lrp family transcriptional regulator
MVMASSSDAARAAREAKDLPASPLDEIDAALVRELARDGRATNAQLAAAASVAPSTAHVRVRALFERGVVSGVHAAVNEAAIGNGLQAMIGVTLRPGSRQESISEFADHIRRHPHVVQLFFVGGVDDFLIHIAVPGSTELRAFVVEHLSAQHSVASTRTSVIFDYHRNGVAASFS